MAQNLLKTIMEAKKSLKADLERKKPIFIQIGLLSVLTLMLIAFEWSSSESDKKNEKSKQGEVIEEDLVPVTRQNETPPPPPPPPPKQISQEIEIVEDNKEVVNDFVRQDFEVKEDEEINIEVYNDVEEEEEEIFVIVEDMPGFNGEGKDGFRKYIAQNMNYPETAQEMGVSGTVYVQFVVNKQGKVINAEVVRGADPSLDKEALRVVSSSPPWTPGKQRGKAVSVRFVFPIKFILQ